MSNLLDRSGFDLSALRFEPDLKSVFESDYWEEFNEVNITGALAPDPGLKLSRSGGKHSGRGRSNKVSDSSSSGVATIDSANGNVDSKNQKDDDTKSYVEPQVTLVPEY